MDTLRKKKAKEFTLAWMRILANFLNIEPDYPIVAHYAKYDRDVVLKKAFNG